MGRPRSKASPRRAISTTCACASSARTSRWKEPSARVDDVALYAGPLGRDAVAYDRAAFLAGQAVKIDAPAGVLQKIKAVPRLKGREDALANP